MTAYPLPSRPLVVKRDSDLIGSQTQRKRALFGHEVARVVALGAVVFTLDPHRVRELVEVIR